MFRDKRLYLGVVVLMALATIIAVVLRTLFGVDLTDESFYLIWSSTPNLYVYSSSQFGFIYQPIFRIVGYSVIAFRIINILLVLGCSTFLCALILVRYFGYNLRVKLLSLAMAATSMAFVYPFLVTPSYNSLVFLAFILSGMAIVLISFAEKEVFAYWVLLGVGGWLAFMAKPTSAALMGVGVVCYLLVSGKFSIRGVFVSIGSALALLCASAFYIDGSVAGFVDRVLGGARLAVLMDPKYSLLNLFRFDEVQFSPAQWLRFCIYVVVLVCFQFLLSRKLKLSVFLFLAVPLLFGFETLWSYPDSSMFKGIYFLSIPAAAVIASLCGFLMGRSSCTIWFRNKADILLGLFFLFCPYMIAFGTNGNYWIQASTGALFWLVGTIFIFRVEKISELYVEVITCLGLLLTFNLVLHTFVSPYRHSLPLYRNREFVQFGTGGLYLSSDFSEYLRTVRRLAEDAGFKKGMPMIDLTGRSPGVLYYLGAKSIGQPWMIGGYEGSEAFVRLSLQTVPCEDIYKAWILLEENGPRSISLSVLKDFGVGIGDYESVGGFESVVSDFPERYFQGLLKPKNTDVLLKKMCEKFQGR